ncbi:MAG: DHH family phosphoesterase, partial [Candidatus Adiutrix sp.]|nr:DHH family phosphoesterase [Candidatus Adiutrix sp.]
KILAFDRIVIQCHDHPDADALASGFGLYSFLTAKGKAPRFIYSGRTPIRKPNLLKMIKNLGIPVEHDPVPGPVDGLLVTVDAQYGAGNITHVPAAQVAVIDHHIKEIDLPALSDLRPFLGSCSTLIWQLLVESGYRPGGPLATALYYGLFSDTGGNIQHPLDKDMWRNLNQAVDQQIIKSLLRSNLSLADLTLAANALSALEYYAVGRFVLVEVPPCDPNLLGFISDTALQVDRVDIVVVFSPLLDGIKFSVRTATVDVNAATLAAWLAGKHGAGGGNEEKAGGLIDKAKFRAAYGGAMALADFFAREMNSFLKAIRRSG